MKNMLSDRKSRIFSDQRGFNVLEFVLVLALIAVIALLIIPNINVFLGIDKKIAAANVEALNMKTAAISYQANTGKYPSDSDALWSAPAQANDYASAPRAYYTFDIGTGRILNAVTDDVNHLPSNPWSGLRWDYTSGSWVKQ